MDRAIRNRRADRERTAAMGPFTRRQTVLLETRRRNGTWVPTPVNLVVEKGRGYFRTFDAAGKYKRLRNFSRVRVAPSTFAGKVTGPRVEGTTRLLEGSEDRHARRLIESRYPVLHRLVPLIHRMKGWHTRHYELVLG